MIVEPEALHEPGLTAGELLTKMSHEIRTPLSGIFGMIELLSSTELDVEQQRFIATARRSASSLLAVFNDILDASELETGVLEIERIPFEVSRAIRHVRDVLAPAAQEKHVELIARYDPEAPRYLVADPGRVRQVLQSLTAHSISRSREGHVLIDAEVLVREDGASLRVAIEGTGSGIPPVQLETIFDSYTPGDLLHRHWAGTGLSMALSKRLVELMGGRIGASSEVGRGSTFWFELPVGLEFELPKFARAQSLADLRVMVVDSSPAERMKLERAIMQWGARCESLGSAAQVLTRLRDAHRAADPFRIVVLSTQLQEMYAETLGDLVKGDAALRDTDLVLLTSLGKQGDAAYVSDIGFSGYLVKPVEDAELEDTLRLVWGSRALGQPPGLVTRHTLNDAKIFTEGHDEGTEEEASRAISGRVLVADENEADRRLARAFLEELGLSVDLVANGPDALEAHERSRYDMIFLHVPSENSLTQRAATTIRARELEQGEPTPIVFVLPNFVDSEGGAFTPDIGCDDVLRKPLRRGDVEALLAKWMLAR
jgi:CheY-like chemotaxis protein